MRLVILYDKLQLIIIIVGDTHTNNYAPDINLNCVGYIYLLFLCYIQPKGMSVLDCCAWKHCFLFLIQFLTAFKSWYSKRKKLRVITDYSSQKVSEKHRYVTH